MNVKSSEREKGRIGVCGHVGVGHAHSNAGFVQDDSVGFAVAAALLRMAYATDTTIVEVEANVSDNTFTVVTGAGGRGTARARRGVTPHERRLVQRALGRDAIFTQALTCEVFGRVYGQGAMEQAAAFQAAVALAVVDGFARQWPKDILVANEDLPGQIGRMMGAVVEIEGVPVSVMALINATDGGIGPVEDLEGIVAMGAKGELMKRLGLDSAPIVTVEGKQFVPGIGDGLSDPEMWVRANSEDDNLVTAECLMEAARLTGFPCRMSDSAYPRRTGILARTTREAGERVRDLGEQLSRAVTAREKVALSAALNRFVSEDLGAVTFMSDAMHDFVAGGGLMSGPAAMLSLLATESYIREWKIPCLTREDLRDYLAIIGKAAPLLDARLDEAKAEMERKQRPVAEAMAWLYETN